MPRPLVVAAGMVALEVVMHPAGATGSSRCCCSRPWPCSPSPPSAPRRVASRTRSLAHTVAAVGLIAAGLIALAVAVGAWRMFLSVHDLHLLSVMLAVAAALSVVFAIGVTRSLRDDLAALRRTTDRVSAGDLDARTGVDTRR